MTETVGPDCSRREWDYQEVLTAEDAEIAEAKRISNNKEQNDKSKGKKGEDFCRNLQRWVIPIWGNGAS